MLRDLILSLFLLRVGTPLTSTLFPYTTLFRSGPVGTVPAQRREPGQSSPLRHGGIQGWTFASVFRTCTSSSNRSEEHTSELQSHSELVCRLLLEKKKSSKLFRSSRR